MNVKLIPVIEITRFNDLIPIPLDGPSWKYADEWGSYNKENLRMAGFEDEIIPYRKGGSLYELAKLTRDNLVKVVLDETKEMREEGNNRDCVGSLTGGYILNVNGEDMLYPQCCGDLSNIEEWERLFDDVEFSFWIGHPSPDIIRKENLIIFDLENSNVNESYVPIHNNQIIEVDKNELKGAIDEVKLQLKHFSEQLLAINIEEKLNIQNLDKLLIYGK